MIQVIYLFCLSDTVKVRSLNSVLDFSVILLFIYYIIQSYYFPYLYYLTLRF